jgi:hypothetical protein
MPRYRGTGRRFTRDERGVSPVVGTVLILVIMMISIGGIMAWGVPAIQGLQERAEYQAVLTQFLQMQSDVRGLRDPQNTRISQISVNDGKLSYDSGSRWVVTAVTDAAYASMYVKGWEADAPTSMTLDGGPGITNQKITLDEFDGGRASNQWTCTSGTCSANIDMDILNDGVGDIDLTDLDTVLRVQVFDGLTGDAKFEAWIFNVGHLEYHLTERNENNRLHFEMGAVFSQHEDFYYLEQTPTIKDPDYTLTPADVNLFVRVLQLTGEVPQGVGGKGEYPIIYHLVDNYGSARGRPSFTDAHGARIQIHGPLEVPFCNYFEDRYDVATTVGWVFEPVGLSCPDDPDDWPTSDVNLRFNQAANDLIFDLTHSEVTTNIRSI